MMPGRLFLTRRGNRAVNLFATAIGLGLVVIVNSPRIGTIVFLSVTSLESGVFSLLYGLRATWKAEPAARAVFWAVFAYFIVTLHLLTLYLWSARWWWTDDLRELLCLGLAVAGLNLVLTLIRVLGNERAAR